MSIIISEKHIRSVIREAFKVSNKRGNRRYKTGSSKLESEEFNIDVPPGNYIHPVLKSKDGSIPRFSSPPSPSRVSPKDGVSRPHMGYDIAVPVGRPVLSVSKGTVAVVKLGSKSAGNYIVINHGSPIVGNLNHTAYMHLSDVRVKKGEKVSPGDIIGLSGNTGRSTGPHLHFQIGEGPDTRKHSSDKAQYDSFFSKAKYATEGDRGDDEDASSNQSIADNDLDNDDKQDAESEEGIVSKVKSFFS